MKRYILGFIALTFLASCDEDFFDQVVDVDIPEHEPALAITANMSNQDSILWAYVTSSVGVLVQDNPEEIADAQVELYKDGTLLSNLPYVEQGFYGWQVPEPLGNEQATYELKVSKDGFNSVSSTQTMPVQVNINDATLEIDGTVNEEGERVDEITITFDDAKDIANYYALSINFEFTDITGEVYSYEQYFNSNDPSFGETENGNYFSDILFDGENYELKVWLYNLYVDENIEDPKLAIRLTNLTKDRYFRETSINNYRNSEDNPFAEPAVIFSNIENGYGIFSLEAVGSTFYIDL